MDGIALLLVSCLFGQAFACSKSGWSQWINEHNVTTKKFPEEIGEANLPTTGGDYENSTSLPANFCATGHGTLTQIECVTAVGGTNYTTAQLFKGHGLVCNINTGFKCVNRMTTTQKCLDYKVRFYCDCANPTTAGASRVGTGAPLGGHQGGGSGLRGGPQATAPTPANGGQSIRPGTGANIGNGNGSSGGGSRSGSGTGPGGKGGVSTPATGHNGAAASKHNGVSGLVPASSTTIGLFSVLVMVLRMCGV